MDDQRNDNGMKPAPMPEPDLGLLESMANGDPENPPQPGEFDPDAGQPVQQKTDQAAIEEYRDMLAGILGPGFAVIFPGWGVTENEVKALSEAWGGVLYKYFPDIGTDLPEIMAAVVTVGVVAPRVVNRVPARQPASLLGNQQQSRVNARDESGPAEGEGTRKTPEPVTEKPAAKTRKTRGKTGAG